MYKLCFPRKVNLEMKMPDMFNGGKESLILKLQ